MEIRKFYRMLYKQVNLSTVDFQDGLVQKILVEEARHLDLIPSVEEVNNTVWSYDSSKAPGSHDFNMKFIKESWLIICKDFTDVVIDFFRQVICNRSSI